jgi:hypothetical protein
MTTVFLASPSYSGDVSVMFMKAVLATDRMLNVLGNGDVSIPGDVFCPEAMPHTLARDFIATAFLKSKCDCLVSCDGDQSWGPATLELIVRAAMRTRGIVGPAIPFRRLNLGAIRGAPEGVDLMQVGAASHAVRLDESEKPVLRGFTLDGRRFLRAAWVGTGMFAVCRETILAMSEKARPYRRDYGLELRNLFPMEVARPDMGPLYEAAGDAFLTEDTSFCFQARSLGIPVHVLVDAPDCTHRIAPNLWSRSNYAAILEREIASGGFRLELEECP